MFYFNPRSRVGNDILSIKFARTTLTFQSTFPRGERQGVSLTALISGNFNPRSRVGNDLLISLSRYGNYLFQSTFPRGERPIDKNACLNWSFISIHVPAWGTTSCVLYRTCYRFNFNPRSRVGNDSKNI